MTIYPERICLKNVNDNITIEQARNYMFKEIGQKITLYRKKYVKKLKDEQRDSFIDSRAKKRYGRLICRKYDNLSQKGISRTLNKAEKYMNNVENGKKELDIIDLINICNIIHCSPNKILAEWIDFKES